MIRELARFAVEVHAERHVGLYIQSSLYFHPVVSKSGIAGLGLFKIFNTEFSQYLLNFLDADAMSQVDTPTDVTLIEYTHILIYFLKNI
jgi:hypothetical protein